MGYGKVEVVLFLFLFWEIGYFYHMGILGGAKSRFVHTFPEYLSGITRNYP